MEISSKLVNQLRTETGAGMMDCKKALVESQGDFEEARKILRKKGLAAAASKAGRAASEGLVVARVTPKGAVLLEVNCETDFVARGEDFQTFLKDIAMHIAAMDPQFVSKDEVPADALAKEREIELERLKNDPKMATKPADVLNNIVEGRLAKFYESTVLLDQPFVKDQTQTVGELVKVLTGKIGEKISVRRFTRYKMGEGIEKKSGDFASEVAEMVKK